MLKKSVYISSIILLVVSAVSCGKFNKLLKSTDLNAKYEAAQAYYAKGDYYHAQQLYEELIPYYRGTAKAEMISYYDALCYYSMHDYTSASEYFKTFAMTFPRSKYTREAQYLNAYCSYLDSPDYTLDQSNTLTAIKELQLYVNLYPKSDSVALCNKFIDDLRFKLETKEFEVSKLYFKLEDYKAAVTSFKNTIKDFPNTQRKEDCMYYIMEANYCYANNSINSKKNERYRAALDAYEALIEEFPQTKYLKDAENVNKNSLKEINKTKTTKS